MVMVKQSYLGGLYLRLLVGPWLAADQGWRSMCLSSLWIFGALAGLVLLASVGLSCLWVLVFSKFCDDSRKWLEKCVVVTILH